MQFIANNVFFHALGYGILNSLWQMGFLWLIFTLINSLFSFTAAQKYFMAVSIKILSFGWFVSTIFYTYQQWCTNYSNLHTGLTVGYNTSIEQATTFKQYFLFGLFKIEQLLPYLSTAYLFVVLGLSINLINQINKTKNLYEIAQIKSPVNLRLFVQHQALLMGIKKKVGLVISNTIKVPITIGFLKPLIILPLTGLTQLNSQQLEAVLLHELAHIKRNDYLANVLLSTIDIFFFFNPINRLLQKEILCYRENSCDDWVLQFKYCPTTYAKALLLYAQNNLPLAMAATQGNEKLLLNRVRRILHQKEHSKKQQKPTLIFILLIISLASFSNLSFKKQINNNSENNHSQLNEYTEALSLKTKITKVFSLNQSSYNISYNQKFTSNTAYFPQKTINTNLEDLKSVLNIFDYALVSNSEINNIKTDSLIVAENHYNTASKKIETIKLQTKSSSNEYDVNDITKDSLVAVVQKYKNFIPAIFKYSNNYNYNIQTTNNLQSNITRITIKRKLHKDNQSITKDSSSFKPTKQYNIVVSNTGKPDKIILVEVWDEMDSVDL